MKTTTTLYRAADTDTVAVGCCFAEDIDDARAYTNNPGFGGANMWRATVEGESLDISSLGDMVAELLDIDAAACADRCYVDSDDVDEFAMGDYFFGRIDHAYQAVEDLRWVRDLLARRYSWVVYEDTYPAQCITWQMIAPAAVDLQKI